GEPRENVFAFGSENRATFVYAIGLENRAIIVYAFGSENRAAVSHSSPSCWRETKRHRFGEPSDNRQIKGVGQIKVVGQIKGVRTR
ncbi:MAG TPA: hypothetical protein PKA76_19400, partial [Pirellulaceae bacterium]|nr:hypothetical protein [Pirellulaceae bacterium]